MEGAGGELGALGRQGGAYGPAAGPVSVFGKAARQVGRAQREYERQASTDMWQREPGRLKHSQSERDSAVDKLRGACDDKRGR